VLKESVLVLFGLRAMLLPSKVLDGILRDLNWIGESRCEWGLDENFE
jgi:hypothetical protein